MSQLVKKTIKSMLGGLGGMTGVYERNFRTKMTIVAFHRVNDTMPGDGLTCSSAKFEAFCKFFRRYFRVVPFAEQVAACNSGANMGGTLSITFDDGYLDNFEVAAPILKKYQLPATFFITTGFVDSANVAHWDKDLSSNPGWMTWDHVRQLAAQGFDIGCHTDTHINMGLCDAQTIHSELLISKQKLQQELGRSINLFAYPYGGPDEINESAIDIVRKAGFVSCVSCYGGTNGAAGADPFHLRRIGIANWYATPHQFGLELMLGRA